jgi:uncharacterized protein involved in exopolysaccharide biosynthesis/Mrp family chromosome partitioning ATPase
MTVPEQWRAEPGQALVPEVESRLPGPPADRGGDRLDFRALAETLARRFGLIVGAVLLGLAAAALVTAMLAPTYSAQVDILMEPDPAVATPASGTDFDEAGAPTYLDTRIEILRSRGLAEEVVAAAGLGEDADFLRPAGGLVRQVGEGLGLMQPLPPPAPGPGATRGAVDRLRGSVEVVRLGASNVLRLIYSDTDPERAARVANAFAAVYGAQEVAGRAGANTEAIGILRERVDELRQEAQAGKAAVQRYRIANNLLSQSATALTEQEISAANQQIALARAEAAEARAKLAAARAQLGGGGSGALAASPTAPVVQALRGQRAIVSTRLADLEGRYLPTHPDVATARAQLADLDRQISAEVARTLRALEARSTAADERLASLLASLGAARGTLAGNNAALVALDGLEREAEASQALYESYLNRYKEVVAQSGAERADARVISEAQVPGRPRSPNLMLNLILGGLMGLLVGMGLALFLEASFAGLTTGRDVESRLGVRYMGGIPLARGFQGWPPDLVEADPGGLFAEAHRSLIAAVRHGRGRRQVIAIASALPGEGKTTVAAATARVGALAGLKVALLDCDTVRAGLSRAMGAIDGGPGLRDLLGGRAALDAVVRRDRVGGADLLPLSGDMAPGERLTDEGGLERLIDLLRERYDLVILDCSPLLPIAEAREVAGLADTVVVVARWRKTDDAAVLSALKLLPWTSLGDVGVALNAIDLKRQARFSRSDPAALYTRFQHYYP